MYGVAQNAHGGQRTLAVTNSNRDVPAFRGACNGERRPYMSGAMNDLGRCGDIQSLRTALVHLCSGFGPLSNLEILTMKEAGRRRAVCLLRLASMERQKELMATLGASRFGDQACVVVDMPPQDQAQA